MVGRIDGKDIFLSLEWKRSIEVMKSDSFDMGEMKRCGWDEKSVKENDKDEADGMKQEDDSTGKMMHIEMCDLWFLKRKTRDIEVDRWRQERVLRANISVFCFNETSIPALHCFFINLSVSVSYFRYMSRSWFRQFIIPSTSIGRALWNDERCLSVCLSVRVSRVST